MAARLVERLQRGDSISSSAFVILSPPFERRRRSRLDFRGKRKGEHARPCRSRLLHARKRRRRSLGRRPEMKFGEAAGARPWRRNYSLLWSRKAFPVVFAGWRLRPAQVARRSGRHRPDGSRTPSKSAGAGRIAGPLQVGRRIFAIAVFAHATTVNSPIGVETTSPVLTLGLFHRRNARLTRLAAISARVSFLNCITLSSPQ